MIRISLPIFILFLAFPGVAQQSLTLAGDNEKNNYRTVLDYQKDYLYKLYYQKVGDMDVLINGKEYFPYYYRSKLKPLLFIDKKHTASIILNGGKYNDLTLQYDTYLDEVIYADSTKVINYRLYQIALNKDPVDGFGLYFGQDSLIFRHFRSNDGMNFNLQEGFYEVVYEGKSKYIIKHQSFVLEKDGLDEYFYSPANYVMVGDVYSRIRSSRDFIKLFGEKSDEIKKFMHTYKVDIRKANKTQIVNVLKYYDTLVTSER